MLERALRAIFYCEFAGKARSYTGFSEAQVASYFFPETGFPSVHIQLVGMKHCNRHGCIGTNGFVSGNILGPQLESAILVFKPGGQAVDSKAQIRQHLIINDILVEHSIRIESIFRQD